ncbi:MAG: hypothetical protein PHU12_03685 [Candidatus Aenigmarchaeota archaeon]|nr:hypothetical protein [Candidatus Aenigmarchaeota archaeon]
MHFESGSIERINILFEECKRNFITKLQDTTEKRALIESFELQVDSKINEYGGHFDKCIISIGKPSEPIDEAALRGLMYHEIAHGHFHYEPKGYKTWNELVPTQELSQPEDTVNLLNLTSNILLDLDILYRCNMKLEFGEDTLAWVNKEFEVFRSHLNSSMPKREIYINAIIYGTRLHLFCQEERITELTKYFKDNEEQLLWLAYGIEMSARFPFKFLKNQKEGVTEWVKEFITDTQNAR